VGYEVDFFTVGDDKPGDAICMRYGNLHGSRDEQRIVIIDGGTIKSGKEIIERILNDYKTKLIDAVFLTHPHQDHMMGLFEVFKQLHVNHFFTGIPWNHSKSITRFLECKHISQNSVRRYLRKDLDDLKNLIQIAERNNVVVTEIFSDDFTNPNNKVVVLGPSRKLYIRCMAELMDDTTSFSKKNDIDPVNKSSMIILFQIDNRHLIFTGDANASSVNFALRRARQIGINIFRPYLFKLPHHGSKRNLNPIIYNNIFGRPTKSNGRKDMAHNNIFAVACASKNNLDYPDAKVIEELNLRRCKVITTHQGPKCIFLDSPYFNNAT